MALATGAAVANNYFAQPLLPVIGRDLHLSAGTAGLIVTVAQLAYAASLFFVLPLGDLLERRRLVVTLSLATAVGLVWFGLSPRGPLILAAAAAVGGTTVMAQVLVPFAASLASDGERGRVVGTVMSGLLVGVLLARTVAGALAQLGTWRTVYLASAGVMLLQALVLNRALPRWRNTERLPYGRTLASTLRLALEEPLLRLRAAYGFLSFATFSVLWTSMAFLLAHRYHLGPALIGLFGLAGAAGALTATRAGRRSDRGLLRSTTLATSGLLVLAWAPLWLGSRSLWPFVVGIVLLDIGAQGLHISNQGAIYLIRPEARSRVTSVYMVTYFCGGALGSALSTRVYASAGWNGVSLLGAGFGAAAALLALVATTVPRLRRVEDPAAVPVVHGAAADT
ncbi:MFS transporter [Aciditerrimonas ferrireducens]|uniref:MFS transporter n=1 Tax=Aciditerrimonas ferrireducens TaxID=667306 RepID=UPI0020066ED0|nr:MFS transporter [Aciditerrimonas ferrireducens]MCK4177844.1 MFS transporter [Aciditerrimonas ferrireducens]